MTTPRYLTPLSGAPTYGPRIAQLSAALGRPFMPWQHRAAALIGETRPDGHFLHPLVVVTVPRQAGKTALVGAVMLHRTMIRKQARVWYTAQNGIKSREQLRELSDAVDLSPLAKVFRSKRGAGDTSIGLELTASRITAHPPTGDSLHGNQSDLNVIDEGWSFDDPQADALMGAITPTQATRPGAQTLIVSTAGTAASTWFHGLVDRGRAGEIPLVDYGVGPDVAVDDMASIAAAHPAIGHTQDASILDSARASLSAGEFMRAYGNRQTTTYDRLLPVELVELAIFTGELPPGACYFGSAVSMDRDETATAACVIDADGTPWVELIDTDTRPTDLPGLIAHLTDTHGGHCVIDTSGPSAATADAATRLRAAVTTIGVAEMSSATTDLLDRLRAPLNAAPPGVRVRAHPALTAAFDVATVRATGDRTTFSRRGSAGSIAALEAVALAVAAAHTAPPVPVPPMIWS